MGGGGLGGLGGSGLGGLGGSVLVGGGGSWISSPVSIPSLFGPDILIGPSTNLYTTPVSTSVVFGVIVGVAIVLREYGDQVGSIVRSPTGLSQVVSSIRPEPVWKLGVTGLFVCVMFTMVSSSPLSSVCVISLVFIAYTLVCSISKVKVPSMFLYLG